jgi:hypothetical protein
VLFEQSAEKYRAALQMEMTAEQRHDALNDLARRPQSLNPHISGPVSDLCSLHRAAQVLAFDGQASHLGVQRYGSTGRLRTDWMFKKSGPGEHVARSLGIQLWSIWQHLVG